MLVQAKMLASGRLPWVSVDTTTSGFLNSLVLLLLPGHESIALFFPRVLSTILILGALGFAGILLARWTSAVSGLLGFTAAALCFSFSPTIFAPDYNAIALPLFLLFSGWWALARGKRLTGGLLLGLVPFAKLQLAVPAAIVFLFQRNQFRFSLKETLAFFSPSLITLIFLAYMGGVGDFIRSYLLMGAAYGPEAAPLTDFAKGTLGDFVQWSPLPHQLLGQNTNVCLLFVFCVAAAFWKWRQFLTGDGRKVTAVFLASVLAVIYPWTGVTHYLLILLPVLPLLTLGLTEKLRLILFAYLSVLFIANFAANSGGLRRVYAQKRNNPYAGPMFSELRRLKGNADSIAVWGWAPELYLATGTLPATRDTIAQFQLAPGPRRDYYRSRFFREILETKPRVIVDAVGGASVFFGDRAISGVETFPDLADHIRENYVLAFEEPVLFGKPGRRIFIRMEGR